MPGPEKLVFSGSPSTSLTELFICKSKALSTKRVEIVFKYGDSGSTTGYSRHPCSQEEPNHMRAHLYCGLLPHTPYLNGPGGPGQWWTSNSTTRKQRMHFSCLVYGNLCRNLSLNEWMNRYHEEQLYTALKTSENGILFFKLRVRSASEKEVGGTRIRGTHQTRRRGGKTGQEYSDPR